jgi:hypothetical protein
MCFSRFARGRAIVSFVAIRRAQVVRLGAGAAAAGIVAWRLAIR